MERVNTIDELISELQEAKEYFGGDFPVALKDPDTDWFLPLYVDDEFESSKDGFVYKMLLFTGKYEDEHVVGAKQIQ
jgi:hypothetical protein